MTAAMIRARHREVPLIVKPVVREEKREAEDRSGTKLSQNFEGNRKMLRKK